MAGAAVAGWVRGRALLDRRIGPEAARELAAAASPADAVAALAATPYGHDVRPGMDLPAAQRAVRAALLWNLRVFAGWAPPGPSNQVRVLAGGFEIVNTVDRLVELAGGPPAHPFALGSLSTSWGAVSGAGTVAAVRAALGRSEWGDPGADDPGAVLLALRLAWARRVFDDVAPAGGWARAAVGLMVGHIRAVGGEAVVTAAARRDLAHVLGRPLGQVPGRPSGGTQPPGAGPGGGWPDWWRRLEDDAAAMAAASRATPAATVGVVGLLAADAWRAGSALALAGGPPPTLTGEQERTGLLDALV